MPLEILHRAAPCHNVPVTFTLASQNLLMVTKTIHFVGAVLVIGLTWLLVLFSVLDWLAPGLLDNDWSIALAFACFLLAVYPARRLFVQRRP